MSLDEFFWAMNPAILNMEIQLKADSHQNPHQPERLVSSG